MRISDWSSDVCSSDLNGRYALTPRFLPLASGYLSSSPLASASQAIANALRDRLEETISIATLDPSDLGQIIRSEEHTSELQSLMRISYAVFCLKKKNNTDNDKKQKLKTNCHKK